MRRSLWRLIFDQLRYANNNNLLIDFSNTYHVYLIKLYRGSTEEQMAKKELELGPKILVSSLRPYQLSSD